MELAQAISRDIHVCKAGPWMIPESAKRPNGSETGEVIVIGVGGSTLRVTHVLVKPGSVNGSEDILIVNIPSQTKSDPHFFNWCAAQAVPVLSQLPRLPLALSWSFPLIDGKISSMGKDFTNVFNGQDLLELFNKALPAEYRILSATHDGTSSLVSGAFNSADCTMALTWGTGVNINLIARDGTFINSEISMLGRPDLTPSIHLETEPWDAIGKTAEFQPFEARIGGLWLGQIASTALKQDVSTRDMGDILQNPSDRRYDTVYKIVTRAAVLVASAIYGLQLALGNPHRQLVVAYTGGVVFEPVFRALLEAQLQKLAEVFSFSVVLTPQKHGSEVGSAIAALTGNLNAG